MTLEERIAAMNTELEAVRNLGEQYRRLTLTAVVDDDYPAVRKDYEAAVHRVIRAFKANGRFPS